MRKVNACPDNGFKSLQLKLLAGTEIKCETCKSLVEKFGFNTKDMEHVTSEWLQGKKEVPEVEADPPEHAAAEPVPHGNHLLKSPEAVNSPGTTKSSPGADSMTNRVAQKEGTERYLKSLEPTFILHPPGSFGKKVPLQCTVCKTPTWPRGKVLDECSWKESSVRHFVEQHVKSQKHYSSVRREEQKPISANMVPCQGLCTADQERGQHLDRFEDEFKLWAVHSKFDMEGAGGAKNTYWHEKNTDTWFVRAHQCERQTEEERFEFQVCPKCIELGTSRGVSRTDGL